VRSRDRQPIQARGDRRGHVDAEVRRAQRGNGASIIVGASVGVRAVFRTIARSE
jgi:hypothetical protein